MKWLIKPIVIFTTQRYASAVCCRRVSVCPSVCPSQAGIVSKRQDESIWYLARRLTSTFPALCYQEIWLSPKIRILPFGTLAQTRELENFATASRSRCQQTRRCRRSSLLTTPIYDNRQVVAVYYKSVNCNPLTPSLRYVADLLYNMFQQLTRFWLIVCPKKWAP